MPDLNRYELGRPDSHLNPILTKEHSLNEVAALIKKIPGLGKLAAITEMHQGDDRVVIAIPQVHEGQIDVPGERDTKTLDEETYKIVVDIKKVKLTLAKAGITEEAREGLPLGVDTKVEEGVTVTEYGVETREEHEIAALFTHFSAFLIDGMSQGPFQHGLITTFAVGTKPSEYFLRTFQESPRLQKFKNLGDDVMKANFDRVIAGLRSELEQSIDPLFPAQDSMNPTNVSMMYQVLKDRFAWLAVGARNVRIAQNLSKIFIANGRTPIILELGQGHFVADSTGKKRYQSIQEELKQLGCSYVVLMPHAVERYLQSNTHVQL